ncbi:alaserpin-like [Drosophila innubila]|uniref:alaserpin-like n=1 Tax=Drosophila innubila TaxID=198719 RepID=UPI00148B632E|nr:alaserpin-like [Drosophila innubila]
MESEFRNYFTKSLDIFSRNFYHQLVNFNPNRNIICSPLSIQTCAGMLRMGAVDGSETAIELDGGLNFSSNYAKEIANGFSNVLTTYVECSVLTMANKLYLMKDYKVRKRFNEILTQKFHSEAENIDFSIGSEAANTINGWVESRTNKLISNIVSSDALSGNTRLVLVNAIHFKGEWTVKFEESETRSEDFFLGNEKILKVSMMNAANKYYFADLPEMDAKALRLAYQDTDLFMLIILPNLNAGLKQLEKKLQTTSLEDITSQLTLHKVFVKLPKFKAEFEQELTPVFKEMGIKLIFNGQAEFGNMLDSNERLDVSKILHKAFIEVNEEGTEVAAATAMVVAVRSMPPPELEPKHFYADHPFYFTIYHANHGCLFVGNFNSPDISHVDNVRLVCQCKREQCED